MYIAPSSDHEWMVLSLYKVYGPSGSQRNIIEQR